MVAVREVREREVRVVGARGEGASRVRGAGIDDARVVLVEVVLGDRVEEDVEVRADVQVGALEGAGQREDEGHVFLLWRLGAGEGDGRGGAGGETAREGRVVVDVEFEEVEEGVGDGGDGAVYVGLDAVLEV